MKRGIGYSIQEVADILGCPYATVAKNSKDLREGRAMSLTKRDINTIRGRLERNKKALTYPRPSRKKMDYNKVKGSAGFSFFSSNTGLGGNK